MILPKTDENIRFMVINLILSKTVEFSFNEIKEELNKQYVENDYIIKECIEDLMENGQVYEIGASYKVRLREWLIR